MEKYYKIAGLIVKMDSWGRTVDQAKPYEIESTDHVDITINTAELADLGTPLERLWPHLDDERREYLGTGSLFYKKLLDFDGMKFHSSCVVVDERAYIFTAFSRTGKSTHTSLWLRQFGNRAYILNDDKPALRLEDGVWYAYGTPWSGKNDISKNARIPIAGIACLERGIQNEIVPFSGVEAIQAIIRQVNRPASPEYRIKVLTLVDSLMKTVPVWRLKCNMDPEAAIVSYEAMSGCKFYKGE